MCASIGNTANQALGPSLISALERPAAVMDTVYKPAAAAYVAQAECKARATTASLLRAPSRSSSSCKAALKRVSGNVVLDAAKSVLHICCTVLYSNVKRTLQAHGRCEPATLSCYLKDRLYV